MVDTRTVEDRRPVHFGSMREILDDAEMLGRAAGVRSCGNWTAAGNIEHVADGIDRSIDGYGPIEVPEAIRRRARARLETLLEEGFPPGIPIPGEPPALEPAARVLWDEALDHLRRAVTRSEREPMKAEHPNLGALSHEQWTRFHCRHAELHFSFLHPLE